MKQNTLFKTEAMAIFSPDRKYRYVLIREWRSALKTVMFIGLNPSVADEIKDDPTIRRCVDFARVWGYEKLIMTNLFALCSTDPKNLKQATDPIGIENNSYLLGMALRSDLIIAAWGNGGLYLNRGEEVKKLISGIHILGLTQTKQPRHPLYLKKNIKPVEWKYD